MSWKKWIDPDDKDLGKEDIPGPANFTDNDADRLVRTATFAKPPVYVGISEQEKNTKQAVAFVEFQGWQLCVVYHNHNTTAGRSSYSEPGNAYIPGWDGWSRLTPRVQCIAIKDLALGGAFPLDRYPTKK